MPRSTWSNSSLSRKPRRSPMARLITVLAVLLVVLVGGMFFLASRDDDRPVERIETVVPADRIGR